MRFSNVHTFAAIASIFVVAWFVLGDLGPPDSHQALAGETKGGDAKAESLSAASSPTEKNSEFAQVVQR